VVPRVFHTRPRVFHQTPRFPPDPAFSTRPRVFHRTQRFPPDPAFSIGPNVFHQTPRFRHPGTPTPRFPPSVFVMFISGMLIMPSFKKKLIVEQFQGNYLWRLANLPPFSLIRDFGKQNTRGNVSEISVSLTWYQQIGSKSTNHSPLARRREGQKVTLMAMIGGFRSDLSITRKTDGNFGNVSPGVLFSKVAYQRKRW